MARSQITAGAACRAAQALDDLIDLAALLRRRLEDGNATGAETSFGLAERAARVSIHLSALEVLRESRERDDAERHRA